MLSGELPAHDLHNIVAVARPYAMASSGLYLLDELLDRLGVMKTAARGEVGAQPDAYVDRIPLGGERANVVNQPVVYRFNKVLGHRVNKKSGVDVGPLSGVARRGAGANVHPRRYRLDAQSLRNLSAH
jgi:hypothetical protein